MAHKELEMNVYFIADTHQGHNADFIVKNNGFNTIEEYDEAIIDGINYRAKADDMLYILGDVSWKDPIGFLNKLRCKRVRIIRGNHDATLYKNKHLLPETTVLLDDITMINVEGQDIVLCHYPMISWNKSHWGSWLLYGHVHNKELPLKGKMFDVAPKKGYIQPYSFQQIKEIMKSLPNNWDLIKDNYNA